MHFLVLCVGVIALPVCKFTREKSRKRRAIVAIMSEHKFIS